MTMRKLEVLHTDIPNRKTFDTILREAEAGMPGRQLGFTVERFHDRYVLRGEERFLAKLGAVFQRGLGGNAR